MQDQILPIVALLALLAGIIAYDVALRRSRAAIRKAQAERDAAEKARAAAEERISLFQKVIDILPLATFLVTPDHRISILNTAVEKLSGISRQQILLEGCFGLFCDHKTNFAKCPGHGSLYSGKPWDGETDLDGRHYEVAVRPLHIGDAVPYSLVALTDRTIQYRQHHNLELLVPRLEMLLRHSAGIQDCLASFATSTSSTQLGEKALQVAASILDATCVYLLRLEPDGTFSRAGSHFRSPEYDVIPIGFVARAGIGELLKSRPELHYTLRQQEDNKPAIDEILAHTKSVHAVCSRIEIDNAMWGCLIVLVDGSSQITEEKSSLLRDAVSLTEISIRRADLIRLLEKEKKDLRDAAARAEQASHAKSMFLATVSHEIRTPLNAIVGYGELLASPEHKPEDVPEYTTGILKASNALLNLINDVLDLAKLESGTSDIATGSCNLQHLFDEMTALFRWRATNKGIGMRSSIAPGFPILCLSESRMRQVLLNLIGNAVKFTDHGEVEWSATATPDGEGTVALAIDVRDTGIGIAPDKREAIFDPFVQDISTRGGKVYEGTGLGLPIVKRLVVAHGGSVTVDAVPGGGSVFRVRLPHVAIEGAGSSTGSPAAGSVDSQSAGAREAGSVSGASAPGSSVPSSSPPAGSRTAGPAREASAQGSPSLASLRVLLADDIPLNLRVLLLHLKALGISRIETAPSGNAALAAIREHPADLVLTDLWMPDGNGIELARAMHDDPALTHIPVVAVTADANASALFDPTFFHSLLTKPITAAKLSGLLSTLFPQKG